MAWRALLRSFGQAPGPFLLALSMLGWIALGVCANHESVVDQALAMCVSGRLRLPTSGRGSAAPWPEGAAWLAMLMAMAPLLLRSELTLLWRSTLPRRRPLAFVGFTVGYGVPWTLFGFAWTRLVEGRFDPIIASTLALTVIAWHCSPLRRRCLHLCHAMPSVRAFGAGMLVDVGRSGVRSGAYCCGICGPAMGLAMSLTANHLVSMTLLVPLLVVERYLPVQPSGWGLPVSISRRKLVWTNLASPPQLHVSPA